MDNAYRAALRSLRPAVAVAALFSAVVNILMLTGSVYMLEVYDRVLGSGSLPTLVGLFVIVAVLYVFLGFYDFLRSRILTRMATRLDLAIGAQTFRAWLRAGLEPGQGSRAQAQPLRELDTLRGFLSGPAIHGLFDMPWIPLYLVVLFLVHPVLGWVTIAGAGVVMVLAWINRAVSARAIPAATAMDAQERRFADRAQGLSTALLPLGMERALIGRWGQMHLSTLVAVQRGGDLSEALAAGSRAFRMLLQSAILTVGAWLVLRGEMSGGMIIAASIISGRALAPADQVIGQWRSIGKAWEAHHRLDDFFETESRRPDLAVVDLPRPSGRIEVDRLTKLGAAAGAGMAPVRILSQVSFALEPGDGLGVIGSSASGKSTLARLLVGAWTPDGGEIRLDGATAAQWDRDRLGRHIGYLPQTVELMPGSIRDNIARFDPDAKSAQIVEASMLAGVHDMILALPEGYATQVGGADSILSGGQVQRLGLARALYGKPRVVVLDEPNSNLDAEGDAALNRAIMALRKTGATVVVMAHRPSALAAVNKVLVLQAGTVAAFGPKDKVFGQPAPAQAPAARSATAQAAPTARPSDGLAPAAAARQGAANAGPQGTAAPTARSAVPSPARPAGTAAPDAQPAAAAAPARTADGTPAPLLLENPTVVKLKAQRGGLPRSRHPVFTRWRA